MTVEEMILLLKELGREDFFGGLEVKFEKGKIIYCKKIEIIKTKHRGKKK
jgi:hypothetical protein